MEKKVNKIPIVLEFENFKGIGTKTLDLNGSYIYLISGNNNVGKTSVVQAIESLLAAKMNIDEPVTRGSKKGQLHGTLPAADGRMYDVYCSYTNERATFYAVDDKGNKVSTVNQIRELFNYSHINVSDFLSWSLTADGIRRQTKIILSLLPLAEQETYELLTAEEAEVFEKRKDAKKAVDLLTKQLAPLPEVDTALIANEGKATARISDLEKQMDDLNKKNMAHLKLSYAKEKLDAVLTIDKDLIPVDYCTATSELCQAITNLLLEVPLDFLNEKAKLEQALVKGREYLGQIVAAKERQKAYSDKTNTILTAKKELEDFEKRLESVRTDKKQILSEGKLPFDNITITDDGLEIDGFAFKDSQVCRSSAIKAVFKMLCKINKSPIILMGQASELDNCSMDEILAIAKETNHTVVFDKVLETKTELCVVGYDNED